MSAKTIPIALIVVVAVSIELSSANNYCNIQSCGLRHTVCKYPNSGPSLTCRKEGSLGSGLTADEKRRIVNTHNEMRRKVASGQETRGNPGPQPAAKHMPDLKWDDELAFIAQRWADQCDFEHDSCRNVARFYVGQNLALKGTTGDLSTIPVEDLVRMWYDEVKNFDRNDVARFTSASKNGKTVGHYTQLVWAKSTFIGCGASKYRKDGFNDFYLVCNYGPGGNFLSQPVYEAV